MYVWLEAAVLFFRREKKGLVVGGCWRGGWNGECARVLAATSQKTLPRLASLQYLWGCSCERAIPVRASSPRCPLKVRTSPGWKRVVALAALASGRGWDEREKLMSEPRTASHRKTVRALGGGKGRLRRMRAWACVRVLADLWTLSLSEVGRIVQGRIGFLGRGDKNGIGNYCWIRRLDIFSINDTFARGDVEKICDICTNFWIDFLWEKRAEGLRMNRLLEKSESEIRN